MLETIKSQITVKIDDTTTFNDRFIETILEEQDKAIERECRFLSRDSTLSPLSLDRLMNITSKELKQLIC